MSEIIELPEGPFEIIYADPPWKYRDKAAAGKRGADFKYDTMRLADIKAMPVEEIAAKDAFLFMWITMPFLPKAEEVMNAWGFKYVTCGFNWIKGNKKAPIHSSGEGGATPAPTVSFVSWGRGGDRRSRAIASTRLSLSLLGSIPGNPT
jgi:N6-adenosine-specific RNA methylase IME4